MSRSRNHTSRSDAHVSRCVKAEARTARRVRDRTALTSVTRGADYDDVLNFASSREGDRWHWD